MVQTIDQATAYKLRTCYSDEEKRDKNLIKNEEQHWQRKKKHYLIDARCEFIWTDQIVLKYTHVYIYLYVRTLVVFIGGADSLATLFILSHIFLFWSIAFVWELFIASLNIF